MAVCKVLLGTIQVTVLWDAFSSRFMVCRYAGNGAKPSFHACNFDSLCELFGKPGLPLSRGLGESVQGNPLTAVAWLANTLGAFDIPLLAGEVILSGSVVPLEPVVAGDKMSLTLTGEGLTASSVSCQFV